MHEACLEGNPEVLADLRRMAGRADFMPQSPQEIAGLLLHTMYMGTKNSTETTQALSRDLAAQVHRALLAGDKDCVAGDKDCVAGDNDRVRS